MIGEMTGGKIQLDLADIQGNIHRPYGRFGFPYTRHLFYNILRPEAGRAFIQGLRPRVTTAQPWDRDEGTGVVIKPQITLNLGLSYLGMRALDLPTSTLRQLPDEFIDGMHCRSEILGDVEGSAPEHWDPIWRDERKQRDREVHLWVSLSIGADAAGKPLPILDDWMTWLDGLVTASKGGVSLLDGHGKDGKSKWQDSCALMAPIGPNGAMVATPKEHFGFTDGISDPVFRGQFDAQAEALAAICGGKIARGVYHEDTSWSALETGEFILGQVDEGQEFPVATQPAGFVRNGTFMVYRKLREDVPAFEAEMKRQAALWKQVTGETDDVAADETVRAKMVGRWSSGVPLIAAPTWADHQKIMHDYADCLEIALRKPRDSAEAQRLADYNKLLTGFRYGEDLDGGKCPFGAHIRRANPRDSLMPGSMDQVDISNRHRILRVGRGVVHGDDPTDARPGVRRCRDARATRGHRPRRVIQLQVLVDADNVAPVRVIPVLEVLAELDVAPRMVVSGRQQALDALDWPDFAELIASRHGAAPPLQFPLQPANTEPTLAVAVSCTPVRANR